MKNAFTVTSVSLIAMLGLASCGGDNAAPSDANDDSAQTAVEPEDQETVSADEVYEFHYGSNMGPYQELEVRINDDLLEAAENYRENRVFDPVVLSAGEHPESQCSVKFEFNYADGVQEKIEGDGWERFYSSSEMEHYTPEGLNGDGEPFSMGWNSIDVEERYGVATGFHRDFLSDDFQSATQPIDCATAPADVEEPIGIAFRSIPKKVGEDYTFDQDYIDNMNPSPEEMAENKDEYDGQPRYGASNNMAGISVNMMVNGDMHIVTTEVNGFNYNEQHGWLPEGMTVDSNGDIIEG